MSKTQIAQNQQGFELIIDDDFQSFVVSLINSDSDIIMTGINRPTNSFYDTATFIYRISNTGDTTSIYYFPESNDSIVRFMRTIKLKSGNILIFGDCGEIYAPDKQTNTIIVLEVNKDLNILWRKDYPLAENYWNPEYSVSLATDSIIYLAGKYDIDGNSSLQRLFLMKFNTDGDTLMTSFPDYPIGNPTFVYDIMNRPDSNGILAWVTGFSYEVVQVLEIDTSLNFTFTNIVDPMNTIYRTFNVKPFTNNTYLMTSTSNKLDNKSKILHDLQVDIMSYDHEFLTRRFLGRQETSDIPAWWKAIDYNDKNNIYVFGQIEHLPSDPFYADAFLFLLDSTLEIKGAKYFNGDTTYSAFLTLATPDGGCVLGGVLSDWQSSTPYDYDIWIKKVFPNDIITNAEDTPDPNDRDVLVYPNPFTDNVFINTIRKGLNFTLFTVNGTKVLETVITNDLNCVINTSNLEKGTYIYKITFKNKVIQTDKLIKY
jgi:hypothetical protein